MRDFDLVIQNAFAVLEGGSQAVDIGIVDERIAALSAPGVLGGGKARYDACGNVVTPGGVDSHVHIPVGSGTHRGDFLTEGKAALAGGTTTVIDFVKQPGENGLTAAFSEKVEQVSRLAPLDFAFHAVIQHRGELCEIWRLAEMGACSFKHIMADCNGMTGMFTGLMFESFSVVSRVGGVATVHAENEEIQKVLIARMKAAGRSGPLDHAESRTVISEVEAITRAILLAQETGCRLHVFHVSSGEGARAVKAARERGVRVTQETCPHYLLFTRDDIRRLGPFLQMNPSLKSAADRETLWEGLEQGWVDAVVSDHYAPTRAEKRKGWEDIWSTEAGVPGLDTRAILTMNRGVLSGRITLERFVEVTATRPARIFGLYPRKGAIRIGADADLVVWENRPAKLAPRPESRVDWTPYEGMDVSALPRATFLRGRMVYDGRQVLAGEETGRFYPARF
ncbi:MAG: amidohydrolase family protein [Bacillota bacterium]